MSQSRLPKGNLDAHPEPCQLRRATDNHVLPSRYRARALSRKLPVLYSLPAAARLADRDTGGAVYKVSDAGESFYLILSEDGVVVTTFRKQDEAEWLRWTKARQKRRGRETRGLMAIRPPMDNALQDAMEAELATCRLIKSAFSGAWQERFDTRRARRFLRPHPRQVRAGQMRLPQQAAKAGITTARRAN